MSVGAISETMPSPQDDNALREFLIVVRRRLWIFLLALVLTAGAALAVSLVLRPVYEVSTAVIADKSPPVVVLTSPGQMSGLFQQQPVAEAPSAATLVELVKSEAVRDAAIARLTPIFAPKKVKAILRTLRVQHPRDTELVRASVKYGDPKIAVAVANAVAQSVIDMDLNARRRLATQAREFIGGQLGRAGQELRASEAALTAFRNESHDVSLSEETQLNLRRLADRRAQLTDFRLQQQALRSGSLAPAGQARQIAPQGQPDPLISTLRAQLATLEVDLSGLRKQFTPAHPAVLSEQAKIQEAQSRLSAEVARHQAALEDHARELTGEINLIEQRLMQVPAREAMLARLTRNAKMAESDFVLLSQKYQEARIAEGSIGSSIRVTDAAKVPEKPLWPKQDLTLIIGIVVGLMLGAAAGYAAEQLDNTVKSAEEAERLLGAPVLGTVPVLTVAAANVAQRERPPLLTRLDRASSAWEAFSALRTHVLRAMRVAQAKCLLVTSALPCQGKSTIAANLAIAAAQTDREVWLVDCDVRRSPLTRLFPEADSPGLSALLADKAVLDDVVRPTVQVHLQCVVSGPAVTDPVNLFDSRSATRFIAQARERADVVLLDSPAVLTDIETEVIGPQADGAVLLVQIGRTDRRALSQARERLERTGVRLIGAILTDGRQRVAS